MDWTSTVGNDIWYSARLLRRQPRYALVVVLTMALGIGATTALFSVTYGVLVKPLPWEDADELVVLTETRGGNRPRFGSFSNAAFLAWREQASTIDDLAAWSQRTVTFGATGEPERVRIAAASASLFRILDAHPLIGSLFVEDDESATNGAVIVLSEGLWRRRFGGDPAVLGVLVRLDGQPHRVVGVLADRMAFPDPQTRAWIPYRVPPTDGTSLSMFNAIARLRPSITTAQAASEGTARGRSVVDTGMTTMAIFGGEGPVQISATLLADAVTSEVRRPLIVLLVAVGLLFLTATANVASLQLARTTFRRRELAIRAALGAGRGRVTRQLIVESLFVGAAGGLGGLALAWLLQTLRPAILPADFPRAEALGIDSIVVLVALGASVLASIVAAVLPALRAHRLNLVESLAENSAAAPSGAGGRSRTARARLFIMAGQVAIACVLLVGASLLVRSFIALLETDRGYDPSGVLTARLALPATMYTPERRHQLLRQIIDRLEGMPGVQDVAFTSELPLTPGGSTSAFTIQSPYGTGTISAQASPRIVSARYFSALGLRGVHGRVFTDADTETSQPVAIVNASFARQYLGTSPLGVRLPMGLGYGMERTEATVIGVVNDVRYLTARDTTHPEMYYSYRQFGGRLVVPVVTLVIRTLGEPATLAATLRTVVREADASLVAEAVMPMEDRMLAALARPRLYAILLGGFAAFALAVAAVGLFGVLSYTVAQRSRELAVRAALGARQVDIAGIVLRQALTVTSAGLAAGLLASLAVTRWMSALLYGVTSQDRFTYVLVPLVIVLIAAIACLGPAWRAARIDPQHELRT
jgi:putative ABC transport system permease protein